jgi:hypothetical protein
MDPFCSYVVATKSWRIEYSIVICICHAIVVPSINTWFGLLVCWLAAESVSLIAYSDDIKLEFLPTSLNLNPYNITGAVSIQRK